MNINQKIAAKISYLRISKNILQSAIAKELEMSQNAYSMLENGSTRITIEKLFAIANYFKEPISKILDIPENIIFNTSDNATAINSNIFNQNNIETISHFYERIIEGLNKTICTQEETINLLKSKI